MEAMPRPRPPHLLNETSRHGKRVWYVRLGKGPRVRIKAAYGSPEFNAEYDAAISGRTLRPIEPAKQSLQWLVNQYRDSGDWTKLSLPTRRQRENILKHVLASAGKDPFNWITPASIESGIDRRGKTPSQARHFLDTMRGIFRWAKKQQHVKDDPTHSIKVAKPKTKGFPVWTDDDLTAFEAKWPRGTRQRVMFDIYLYTGLRRGDAATLGRQHVRNGVITLDTEKTGTRVTIPVLPELQITLDAGPTGDLAFIAQANGGPLVKESLGTLFKEACLAAGINKSAHGLRKAAATHAANNGATVAELEAIFGWEGGQMASLYTRSADRRGLAAGAMKKLSRRTKPETSIPAPSHKVRDRGQKDQ